MVTRKQREEFDETAAALRRADVAARPAERRGPKALVEQADDPAVRRERARARLFLNPPPAVRERMEELAPPVGGVLAQILSPPSARQPVEDAAVDPGQGFFRRLLSTGPASPGKGDGQDDGPSPAVRRHVGPGGAQPLHRRSAPSPKALAPPPANGGAASIRAPGLKREKG